MSIDPLLAARAIGLGKAADAFPDAVAEAAAAAQRMRTGFRRDQAPVAEPATIQPPPLVAQPGGTGA